MFFLKKSYLHAFLLLLGLVAIYFLVLYALESLPQNSGNPDAVYMSNDELVNGLQGSLLITVAQLASNGDKTLSVYDVDPTLQTSIRPVFERKVTFDFYPKTDTTGVAIQFDEELRQRIPVIYDLQKELPEIVPLPDAYQVRAIYPSPFDNWYLVEIFTTKDIVETQQMKLSNWKVMLINTESEETLFIDNAASPQWLLESKSVAFIREDGVYKLHLASGEETLIYDGYTNLSAYTGLAIDSRERYLVLTMPTNNRMSLAQLSDSGKSATELYYWNDGITKYSSPVFSPDGNTYAVVTNDDASFDPIYNIYSNNVVTILSPYNTAFLHEVPLSSLPNSELKISSWTLTNLVIK